MKRSSLPHRKNDDSGSDDADGVDGVNVTNEEDYTEPQSRGWYQRQWAPDSTRFETTR